MSEQNWSTVFDWTAGLPESSYSDNAYDSSWVDSPCTESENPWDVVWWDPGNGAKNSPEGGYSVRLPGVCSVEVTAEMKMDIRTSAQAEGATYVYQGQSPREITITSTCWHPKQMQAWHRLVPRMIKSYKELTAGLPRTVQTPTTKKYFVPFFKNVDVPTGQTQSLTVPPRVAPPSYKFVHPALMFHGVQSVIPMKFTGPKLTGKGGTFTVEISCKEWLPFQKVYTLPAVGEQKIAASFLGNQRLGGFDLPSGGRFTAPK